MNDENLKNGKATQFRSGEQAAINGSKGGIASGKSRAEKRDLRRAIEFLLEKDFTDKNGNTLSGAEAITAKLFEQAMKGNIKAFETIRDSVGQKMPERIMIAEVDQSIIEEVEQAVLKDE